jgi:hypothetical protein
MLRTWQPCSLRSLKLSYVEKLPKQEWWSSMEQLQC